MDPSLVEALVGAFGPFLLPVLLFAAGLIGYGVLFLAGRVLSPNPTDEWRAETDDVGEGTADPDRHEG
jgi:hypothetical protein